MSSITEKLAASSVGIAGLGGLGSTVASALARAGVGKLIVADFDVVEESNLNRQHYFTNQIGMPKVEATIENLTKINPNVQVQGHIRKLTPADVKELFANVDIIAECFDQADAKRMLVETVLRDMTQPIVAGNGMAGYGKSNEITTQRVSERFVLVGDGHSGIDSNNYLTAARVWITASHQANAILELLIDELK